MSSAWPPDDDRPDGDGRVEPLPFPVVIPDDARELERDRVAWLREQRAAHRRAHWGRLTAEGASDATTIRVLVGIVLLAGLASSMLLLLSHWTGARTRDVPSARPLASAVAAPGAVGGLLPPARVRVGGTEVPVRALRPAVLLLVPETCSCDRAVGDLVAQAGEYHLPVYLADSRDPVRLTRLAARSGHGQARALLDPSGALAHSFAPRGVTAVLVHGDGVVGAVITDIRPGARLETRLRPLLGPGPRRTGATGPSGTTTPPQAANVPPVPGDASAALR